MFEVRYATEADKAFWFALDTHISENEFLRKIRDRRAYIISDRGSLIGVIAKNKRNLYIFFSKRGSYAFLVDASNGKASKHRFLIFS